MFNPTVLALVLGLPFDAQTVQASPVVAIEVPPSQTSWTENWAVSLSTGRSFYDSRPDDPTSDSMWQLSHRQSEIRVTHQGAPLVFGVALHRIAYPAGPDISAIGAGFVLGARHPLRSWLYAEFDGTLGLQKPYYLFAMTGGDGPPLPPGDTPPNSWGPYYYMESGPLELYVRLGAGVALQVASWLDIPVRLNLHLHPLGESHSLGAASIGLRCLLP